QLDSKSNGVNEILAVNDHEFLVIERDGNAGTAAAFKKIFHIDIAEASDIRAVATLPQTGTPVGVTPVSKDLFIDLLDPAFGLVGETFPEKIEGPGLRPRSAGRPSRARRHERQRLRAHPAEPVPRVRDRSIGSSRVRAPAVLTAPAGVPRSRP